MSALYHRPPKGYFWAFTLGFLAVLCLFSVLKEVSAAPKTAQVSSGTGMTVVYPKTSYYQIGNSFDLNFHIFNSSLASLTNATTDCWIHIYNHSGEHIVDGKLVTHTLYDYEYEVSSSTIYNQRGTYDYIVWCNNTGSKEGGFISDSFMVADGGEDSYLQANLLPMGMIILLPVAISLICLIGAVSLGKEHDVLKIALYILSFIPLFVSLNFAMMTVVRYYGWAELQDRIGQTVWLFGLMFAVLIFYFLLYLIAVIINTAAQKRKERLEY